MEIPQDKLRSLIGETYFLGAIYKQPNLFIKFRQYLADMDFSTEKTKFFYKSFCEIYDTVSKTPDENTISGYMCESETRLGYYKSFGYYQPIEDWTTLCNPDDVRNYFEQIKKFSLLREYYNKGFPVHDIISHKQFELLKSKDIHRIMTNRVGKIYTKLRNNEDMTPLNKGCIDYLIEKLDFPIMGLTLPYEMMSEAFSGIRKKQFWAWGMLSNAGKSRFLMKIISHLAFVHGKRVLLLSNEMTMEEMKDCLITTTINNPEFQKLHGIETVKQQKEIMNGLYRDKNGKFIIRQLDVWGKPEMTTEEFVKYLQKNSPEFNQVCEIMHWLEDEFKNGRGQVMINELGVDYTDDTIRELIENAKISDDIDYVFYDTFKADKSAQGDWASLKNTATLLKELANELNIFIGANIQLTDDTTELEPLKLSSNNIANSKQIKHVLDALCLFKEIPRNTFDRYRYTTKLINQNRPTENNDVFKTENEQKLDPNKRYYVCRIDKNRIGEKLDLLFELDLDFNTWTEVGQVYLKGK